MRVSFFSWFWVCFLYILNALDFVTTFVGVSGNDYSWEKNEFVRWVLVNYGWNLFFVAKFVVFGFMLFSVVWAIHSYVGKKKVLMELGVNAVFAGLCFMYVVVVVGNFVVLGWV